jgi:hypothetical protein
MENFVRHQSFINATWRCSVSLQQRFDFSGCPPVNPGWLLLIRYGSPTNLGKVRTMSATKTVTMKRSESLIGRFFHSYDKETGKVLGWQGQVIGRPQKDTYLVQLFEWWMGEASKQILVSVNQMLEEHWQFYPDRDAWLFAYEQYDGKQP